MDNTKIKWTEVESSNVKEVYYEQTTLCVRFTRGGLYAYHGVDHETYLNLVGAESVGKYLNDVIKPYYPFTQHHEDNDLKLAID